MPSILENLNALLAGKPILRDPLRDALYRRPARPTPQAEQPTGQRKPVSPDRYRYYNDTGGYVYKRYDE